VNHLSVTDKFALLAYHAIERYRKLEKVYLDLLNKMPYQMTIHTDFIRDFGGEPTKETEGK